MENNARTVIDIIDDDGLIFNNSNQLFVHKKAGACVYDRVFTFA
jgi:hypothetical protein